MQFPAWDTEDSIHSRIARTGPSRGIRPGASPGHPTCTHSEGHRVEPRRPEPQEPRAHRPDHDRRRGLRRARAHEPEAGADPLDRVPAARRRLDLPGRVARGRQQRRVDPDRDRRSRACPAWNRHRPPARRTPRSSRRPSRTAPTSPRPSRRSTQAINRIKSQLPEGVEPNVISASIDDFPVIQLAVTGYDDEQTIQAQLEATVVPELEDVAGVNAASIVGGVGQRVTITPDQAALAGSRILPAGDPRRARPERRAVPRRRDHRGRPDPHRADRLEDHVGRRDRGAPARARPDAEQFEAGTVTIADVATVEQDQDPVTTISRVDGKPALTIAVTKLPAANTVDVSQGVLAVLPDLEESLGGAEFTVVFDQAPYIQQSIEALAQEGLLGLFFAVLVILVFLLSVRATLVTAISIPTSVLITFIGIQAFGYSLNILTLGALTIAIGRVVDDSIVVIENIKRHYVGDADKMQSILRAVREVASAITASTVTTVAVFLPIAFVGDVTGELFRPFALTVTIAMTASLFVALTIVPVLAYWFLRPGKPILDADGARGRPGRPGGAAQPAAEVVPADPALDAEALVDHPAARGARARRHDRGRTVHEDELPRRLGPEHVHDDPGHRRRAEPRGRGCRVDRGRGRSCSASTASRPSRCRSARAARRCATPSPAEAAASRTRSRPTPTPTRSPCAKRSRPRSPTSTTPAPSRSPAAAADSAPATSRSTSPRPTRPTLQEATDAVVDAVVGAEGIGQVSSNLVRLAPLHRRHGRSRRGGIARALRGRRRRARVEHDAAAADRHGRDRRHRADGLPRRIADAGDDRRAAASSPCRARPARSRSRRGRDRRGERGPDLDHDRGRAAYRDRHGHAVHRRPHDRLRLGEHRPGRSRPARLGGCRPRRRRLAAAGCLHAARPRAARGDPDRLHRDGGDLQVAAPAAAAARLGAVRGDRRDPAADHHRRAARRRVAHRRADAHRHRRDERDRPRRPREPVPRPGVCRRTMRPSPADRDVCARSS